MIGLYLAQYRIDAELGRGGMGIVYRATDTKLNRSVALKILPASVLGSSEDRARFFREAQAAASLSHPNIATVYGIDEAVPHEEGAEPAPGSEKRPFIAMEYIEGETLQERIKTSPLKLGEAVSVTMQVAEALKAAHGKEIVHRDIKSANVMLTADGVAKVLDFGLAKTQASTMLTRQGSTLGTVAYMSPEQARGQEVDGRSDLYSLGTVLYEMVAGRLPFAGDYEQAILYGILNEPPEPLTALRTGVPMQLEWVVNKLLSKDADYRYQTAGDLLADLKSLDLTGSGHSRRSMAMSGSVSATRAGMPGTAGTVGTVSAPKWVWPVVALALAFGGLGTWVLTRTDHPTPSPTRSVPMAVSDAIGVRPLAVSPDGEQIIMRIVGTDGSVSIRAFQTGTGVWSDPLPLGSANYARYSPSGEWLLASRIDLNGTILRYRLADRSVLEVPVRGAAASWLGDEEILYTPADFGLWRAGLDGTGVRLVAKPDSGRSLDILVAADVVPGGGQAVVSLGWWTDSAVGIVDLETGQTRVLIENACCARILPSGHLLYGTTPGAVGPIRIRPFDTGTGSLTGVEVAAGLGSQGIFDVAIGLDGTVAYPATAINGSFDQYFWLHPTGQREDAPIDVEVGQVIDPYGTSVASEWGRSGIEHPQLSHGGDRFVAARLVEGEFRVFVNDFATGSSQRVSFGGPSGWPSWSPDDEWIYYVGRRGGKDVILRRRSDLSAAEETVLVGNGQLGDPSVTPDGTRMLYYTVDDEVGRIVSLADTTRQEVFSPTTAFDPTVSPDGRYVAFESQGLDVRELGGTALYQVAEEEGDSWDPTWSADGSWLYYRDVGTLYRVPVTTQPVFRAGPRELVMILGSNFHYSLHPDGERILIQGRKNASAGSDTEVRITFNWFTTVNQLAPRGK